ncbi:hypothetical protein [Halobacillus sp. BBL2006]|uniref:hypothetical protein n=1 Tax=Halobacillus sp. BBL2006 TaxID=1543706 RepID=UPI000542CF8C|nr:hypothetical protein [Halobacillus sp. BBL2006]KHE71774.1 hypothetical protein LD39_08045 [Halobacillus sp. BBL2006]
MAKKFIYLLGVGVIILAAVFYMDHRYFFNPVVFNQDSVTPYDWLDYERPLTMTYVNLDEHRKTTQIDKEKEIRNLLDALKNSPKADETEIKSDVQGALKLSSRSTTLLEVYIYENHWRVLRRDRPTREMTTNLENLLNQY